MTASASTQSLHPPHNDSSSRCNGSLLSDLRSARGLPWGCLGGTPGVIYRPRARLAGVSDPAYDPLGECAQPGHLPNSSSVLCVTAVHVQSMTEQMTHGEKTEGEKVRPNG